MRTVITVDETRETISFFGSTAAVGRLAGLHRRYRRRTQSQRRQCAAEDPRGAAAAIAVPAGQPRAGPGAADDPVALPQTAVAAAGDRRRDPAPPQAAQHRGRRSRAGGSRRGGGRQRRARADAARRRRAEAAAADRGAAGDACRRSIRANCMRWAMRSAPATGSRSPPSSTASIAGSSERLRADDANANANLPRLARLAEVWEKIIRAARDTEAYNLERKPLVFSVFGLLAEATR